MIAQIGKFGDPLWLMLLPADVAVVPVVPLRCSDLIKKGDTREVNGHKNKKKKRVLTFSTYVPQSMQTQDMCVLGH